MYRTAQRLGRAGRLRMKRRTWLYIGAGFGFSIHVLLNILARLGPWHVRPIAYLVFRPDNFLLEPFGRILERFISPWPLQALLVFTVNALIFGALAYGLRRGFLVLITLLLVIVYIAQPPSDTALQRRFALNKPTFERLAQKTGEMPSIVRIEKLEIEDTNGMKYKFGEKQSLLSPEAWEEYRKLFEKAGLEDGVYRWPQTGEMLFLGHTLYGNTELGQFGTLGTHYGFVHCPPSLRADSLGFIPCIDNKEQADTFDYRYKRLSDDWYLYEIFRMHSSIN
jgi:hypothetical protein